MKSMNFKGTDVYYIDVDANPDYGFYFPFTIIIPKVLNDKPDLIYVSNLTSNNSGKSSTMEELVYYAKESDKDDKKEFGSIDPMMKHLCLENGNPMVIPYIPRLKDFRPNFLGRDCLLNEFKLKGNDSKFEKYMYMYKNLADQHKSMIEMAIYILRAENINVDDKAILCGYSEGAKFASHLSLLHPEIIKAIIAGGTGGAMSIPLKELNGYEFTYPIGVSDIPNFDYDSFKKISFFFYMGETDKADSAIPYFENYTIINERGEEELYRDECGNLAPKTDENGNRIFILDKNGNYTAKYNLFSDTDVNTINRVFGTITQERFKKQQQIYESLGLKSVSKLYKGHHRSIFDERKLIFVDVDAFIDENLKNNIDHKLR